MCVCVSVTEIIHTLGSKIRIVYDLSLASHQVFIRELISNGSDALEKLRHRLITAGGETAQMEIHLQTDGAKGTFTIQVHYIHKSDFCESFWPYFLVPVIAKKKY